VGRGAWIAVAALGLAVASAAVYGLGGAFESAAGSDDEHGVYLSMALDLKAQKMGFNVNTETGAAVYSLYGDRNTKDGFLPAGMNLEGARWGVQLQNKAGQQMLIDRLGRRTIDPPAFPFGDFAEGLAPARPLEGNQCGYLDRAHILAIPAIYDQCGEFREGLAAVSTGGKWGYVDRTGALKIPAVYDSNCFFSEGLAVAQRNGVWEVIDAIGKSRFTSGPGNAGCQLFFTGLLMQEQAGQIGFVDKDGAFVVPAKYDTVSNFEADHALASIGTETFLIDKSGKETPVPEVVEFKAFEQGLARVRIGGSWGLIDATGRLIVPATFQGIQNLKSGLRAATQAGETRFFDTRGAEVKAPVTKCMDYDRGAFACFPQGSSPSPIPGLVNGAWSKIYVNRSGVTIGGIEMKGL
jgi:hypothetical protein